MEEQIIRENHIRVKILREELDSEHLQFTAEFTIRNISDYIKEGLSSITDKGQWRFVLPLQASQEKELKGQFKDAFFDEVFGRHIFQFVKKDFPFDIHGVHYIEVDSLPEFQAAPTT